MTDIRGYPNIRAARQALGLDGDEPTITVPEAGRLVNLGRDASYQAVKRGEIPVMRFGKNLRVPVVALAKRLLGEGS